jgi:hypothetical protein
MRDGTVSNVRAAIWTAVAVLSLAVLPIALAMADDKPEQPKNVQLALVLVEHCGQPEAIESIGSLRMQYVTRAAEEFPKVLAYFKQIEELMLLPTIHMEVGPSAGCKIA